MRPFQVFAGGIETSSQQQLPSVCLSLVLNVGIEKGLGCDLG